ncbi:hypothetical protein C475_02061 [Halosimplex carlsbadense 2-9-1]|uniref:Uncharacterized protein n=1 Tax=Halosimplex carlsbadense 2-9-1 TaxID=797114 RepID=M0D4B5_9EURY|nr:hypothetical protein [Halosimplex carlsbadense]ELZ29693.1 hypothetical protein C475_02061 [Halosimplex carlsbadense 2-9-1]
MVTFADGDAFALLVVTLAYVPVVRAYALEGSAPRLVAAYTALLVGRAAALLASAVDWAVLPPVEYGVGVALAALLFAWYCYGEYRRGDRGRAGVRSSSVARDSD